MNSRQRIKLATTILFGLCFAVMILLFVIAYIPNFAPTAYERLRLTGLIVLVPLVAVVGGLSSIAWLWLRSKKEGNHPERGNNL